MTQRIIDTGIQGNDGTGDSIRASFQKVNDNFTELYAAFGSGGTIKLTDLGDGPTTYSANQVIMVSKTGLNLTARDVEAGPGIIISKNDDTKLTITASISGISNDEHPTLGQHLNAASHVIGNLADPTEELRRQFNNLYPNSTISDLSTMAISLGYANKHYVGATPRLASNSSVLDYKLTLPLKTRDEPSLPQTSDPDYDATLTGNFVATEVLPRSAVVYRGGDTMTGTLTLGDHPTPFEGFGTPNSSADLQAATKLYVDSNTYFSGTNLYVSATKGDDLQTNTPVGREGRAWQYAYKTIGAAALQAENLINLSQTEPGPYKQTITWSTTTTQYPSVVQSVQISNGNSGSSAYTDAAALLAANKSFIQAETIAYLNKKYVNTFTLDKVRNASILQGLLNGIGYDLVLGTNYNTFRETAKLFNSYNSDLITNQLTQLIDGINYAKNEILSYGYTPSTAGVYIEAIIQALAYDVVFGSNFQSIQTALSFATAGSTIESDEIATLLDYSTIQITDAVGTGAAVTLSFAQQVTAPFVVGEPIVVTGMLPDAYNGSYTVTGVGTNYVTFNSSTTTLPVVLGVIGKGNLINNILTLSAVTASSTAIASLKSNADVISLIVQGGAAPTPVYGSLPTSIPGQTSARDLLLNNIAFIQAEISGWLRVHYPALAYSNSKSARDIKYIIWSLIYDLMYDGNSQSVYTALKYWSGSSSVLSSAEKTACSEAISYINTLAQAIVTNTAPSTLYQQSISQYINSTLSGNVTATATVVSGSTASKTLTVATGANPISVGQVITGSGFTAQQTVKATAISGANTIITLSDFPNTNPTVSATLTFTSPVLGSISSNVSTIYNTVSSSTLPSPSVSTPTVANSTNVLQAVRTAMTTPSELSVLKTAVTTYIEHSKFSIIENSAIVSSLNTLFNSATDLLTYGSTRLYATASVQGGSTGSYTLSVTSTSGTIAVGQTVFGSGFNGHKITGVSISGTNVTITLDSYPTANPSGNVYFILLPTLPTSGILGGQLAAVQALLANINFIANEVTGYITSNYPTLSYSTASSVRDVIFIVEALIYDIIYGGNSGIVNAASQFWVNGVSQIPNKYAATQACNAAMIWAQTISLQVTQNQTVTTLYSTIPQVKNSAWTAGLSQSTTIANEFNIVLDIMANNNAATYTINYPSFSGLSNPDYQATKTIISNNATSIINSVNDYLTSTYTGNFKYNQATCSRDIGYIIDGISIDLVSGGNYQSINAGRAYYRNVSAKSVAIGTQYTETLDGINYAKTLAVQVLTQSIAYRYQTIVSQTTDGARNAEGAISSFNANYKIITDIIQYGIGVAPTENFGSGIYTITMSNGGNGFVDQGKTGSVHIIPAKVLVGATSGAYGQIVSYTQGGGTTSVDTIVVRMTRPGFFTCFTTTATGTVGSKTITVASATNISIGLGLTGTGIALGATVTAINGTTITLSIANTSTVSGSVTFGEQLQFGETVSNLQITLMLESGIYYEDFPIRLPSNVSIKGDDFRRAIIRPYDRISQSPWVNTFFYRDGVIDAMQLNPINYSVDSATPVSLTLSGKSGNFSATLASGQAPQSWIGLILTDNTSDSTVVGKAVVNSVNGNVLNCTSLYPFSSTSFSSGAWHLYPTSNYGRHYLSNPLDYTSTPLNNKLIDVFMMNDATHISYVSFQGHGGFAVVLDPAGQIKTKSPFVRDTASFSGSTTAKRFAGGMFVDGFAGRLFGTISAVQQVGANSQSQITVIGSLNSGLDVRAPQVPSSFFVQGSRYQIDDIVSYDSSTYTAILTLDVSTPFNIGATYSSSTMNTNMTAVIDSLAYDLVLGTNYKSVRMGIYYLLAANAVSGLSQTLVTQAVNYIGTQANAAGYAIDAAGLASINANVASIVNIINNGVGSIPTLTFTAPVGGTANQLNAKNILQDSTNKAFIVQEITSWIAANYTLSSINGYSSITAQRDFGYIVDAITYDVFYATSSSSNSAMYDLALTYWNGANSILTSAGNYSYGTLTVYLAAMARLSTVMQQMVVNTSVTKSAGNNLTQNTSLTAASSAEVTRITTLMTALVDYVTDGNWTSTSTVRTLPNITSQATNLKTDYNTLEGSFKTDIITNSGLVTYLNNGAGIGINIEMAGNRSMLGDNFTQVNDMGYGIVATNGGVSEQVSTFTYYCYTSQWAINGGQIRSVSGSSAHGVYGLRSTGYNPTELPDSVTLVNNMVQTARIYKQGITASYMSPYPTTNAFNVYIVGYNYIPANNSELEIDHTLSGGGITRYVVSQVQRTNTTINGQSVLNLTLGTNGLGGTVSTGLAYPLYDGQVVAIKAYEDFQFSGVNAASINSTTSALQFIPSLSDIYSVTAYLLTYSTGDSLPANNAIVENNSVFNYYQLSTDNTKITTVDPTDGTKTQGSKVGDNKIAVIPAGSDIIINQLNTGNMLTSWGGRVHRISSYTREQYSGSGTVITQTPTLLSVSGTTLTLSSNSGLIVNAPITFTSVTQTPTLNSTNPTGNKLTLSSGTGLVAGETIVFTAVTQTGVTTTIIGAGDPTYPNQISVTSTTGMVVGEPITFSGTNFGGLTNGTFYILTIPRTGYITVSASYNGSVVAMTGGTGAMAYTAGNTLGGISAGTTYYITSVVGNDITVSTSYSGSNVSVTREAGSWTSVAGGIFGGISSGTTYYVASTTNSNLITISSSVSGGALSFSSGAGSWSSLVGASASGLTLVINNPSGTISSGQAITGTGFSSGQTVNGSPTTSGSYTLITLSAIPNSLPSGTLTFGTATNAYVTIDPNPIFNSAANGSSITAVQFLTSISGPILTSNGQSVTLVSWVAPYAYMVNSVPTRITPVVDSYVYKSGSEVVAYNGNFQVSAVSNYSTINVATTTGIVVGMTLSTGYLGTATATAASTGQITVSSTTGMSVNQAITFTLTYNNGLSTGAAFGGLSPGTYYIKTIGSGVITVSATAPGGVAGTAITLTDATGSLGFNISYTNANAIIPGSCIVQSIVDTTNFTVSPSAWLPVGTPLIATVPTTVASVTVLNGGSGYNQGNPPAVTFTGGGDPSSVVQAVATATINQYGVLTKITVTSPGQGYTSTPTVTVAAPTSGVTASVSAVMSSAATYTGTVVSSTPTNNFTLAFPTAPGLSTTATATTNSTVTMATTAINNTGQVATLTTGIINGATLTFASSSGATVVAGMVLSGGTVLAGTYIVSGSGLSWIVNKRQYATVTTANTAILTYAGGSGTLLIGAQLTGGTITAGTYVTSQLTATNSAAATTTATGTISTNTITVASATGIALYQYVVAAGVPVNTYVSLINGTTITLTQSLTSALSSTAINFYTAGQAGTYSVSQNVSQSSTTITATANLVSVGSNASVRERQVVTFNGTNFGGVSPVSAATGTFSSGSLLSTSIVITGVSGTIAVGNLITGSGFNGTQVVVSFTQTGTTATITMNAVPSATPSGTITFSSYTYYVTASVPGATGGLISISTTAGGSNTALTTATGSLVTYFPRIGGYTPGSATYASKSGSSSPYSVTYTLGTSTYILANAYVLVSGAANPLYNGVYQTSNSTGATTSLVLTYPYDPGTYTTGTITITPSPTTTITSSQLGINRPFDTYQQNNLEVGYPSGTAAQLTTKISTSRATSHDFLNIGTGGYNTTNYPSVIYGNSSLSPVASQQVLEETVGRVFFVSTDQDGIFRVGKFFTINQATGSTTLGQSIALNNLNGLGFKNGITVTSFSNDSTFSNPSSTAVPTQLAISNFIDYRLGLTSGGSQVASASILGPGFLPLNGALAMSGNLNMNGSNIINLVMPLISNTTDVTNKGYVDTQVTSKDSLYKLGDVTISSAANGNFLVYDSGAGKWKNIAMNASPGDVSITFTAGSPGTIATSILSGKIYDSMVNSVANIQQSKLILQYAGKSASASTTTINVSTASSLTVGKVYVIAALGSTTQLQWNTLANTSGITYAAGSVFTAAATSSSGTGTVYDNTVVQATLGLSSYDQSIFTTTNGWVSLADSTGSSDGIALGKLRYIATGTLLGNRSGNLGAVSTITPAQVITDGGGLFVSNFSGQGVLTQSVPTYSFTANFSGTGMTYVSGTTPTVGSTITGSGIPANTTIASGTSPNFVLNQAVTTGTGITITAVASGATTSYSVTPVSVSNSASSYLVKSSTDGSVDVLTLKVAGQPTLSLSGSTLRIVPPSANANVYSMTTVSSDGSAGGITTTTYGIFDTSNGTLKANTFTAGGGVGGTTEYTGIFKPTSGSVIDLYTNSVQLKVNNITTGASGNNGTITGTWTLGGASTLQATYADLAEYYEGDQEYEAGTVLVFGGDKEVTTTTQINDTRSAGVVTTNPAYVMNEGQTGIRVCIALAGRVPVKVIGRVRKGDMLTTSATPGYAVKALNPTLGAVIGKALEDKDYGEAGVIQVAVGRV